MSLQDETTSKWVVSDRRKYPKTAKLCDYIVVAEFDIDTGSTVRHQYPDKIEGVTEDWLAENMLPEGVHNRDTDSTFIFLNRDKPRLDEDWLINPSLHKYEQDENEKKNEDENRNIKSNGNTTDKSNYESNYNSEIHDVFLNYNLIHNSEIHQVFRYGLNLVHTKHDATVRRGAIVKAMAIFSSYPIVDILEQPLYNALEIYFKNSNKSVLADLYNLLNTCDMSKIPSPSLLEKNLMRCGIPVYPIGIRNIQNIYHIPSSWNYKIELSAPIPDFSPSSIPTSTSLSTFQQNSNPISSPISNITSKSTSNSALCSAFNSHLTSIVESKNEIENGNELITLQSVIISVPLSRQIDCIGDINITLLVKYFGDSTMRIYTAILMRQRVLFVGYNHAARDICKMVLSAVAMVSPIPNVLKRCYPYANLTDLSFLEVKCLRFFN